MMSEPGGGQLLSTLPEGAEGKYLGEEPDGEGVWWAHVEVDGAKGWIHSDAIEVE